MHTILSKVLRFTPLTLIPGSMHVWVVQWLIRVLSFSVMGASCAGSTTKLLREAVQEDLTRIGLVTSTSGLFLFLVIAQSVRCPCLLHTWVHPGRFIAIRRAISFVRDQEIVCALSKVENCCCCIFHLHTSQFHLPKSGRPSSLALKSSKTIRLPFLGMALMVLYLISGFVIVAVLAMIIMAKRFARSESCKVMTRPLILFVTRGNLLIKLNLTAKLTPVARRSSLLQTLDKNLWPSLTSVT